VGETIAKLGGDCGMFEARRRLRCSPCGRAACGTAAASTSAH